MEAVLKNSINSTITSQVSNLSTARLLIDHIKRLVEDDMKSTVEAFRSIESEIDVELKSTTPEKNFFENKRISHTRSCTSSPQFKKTDKRNSLQPNYRVPSAASSKRNFRTSVIGKPVLDSYLESDNTMEDHTNSDTYEIPPSQQAKSPPEDFQRFESMPEATSTPIKDQFSSPSIVGNRSMPSQSESTITNPYNNQNEYRSYSDHSKLLTVEAMYHDLKADLNRIFQRFAQESNETDSPVTTTNENNYHDTSASLLYDEASQTSFGTSRRSTATKNRYGRGFVLPQLLVFGDNWNNNPVNDSGKSLTIISEPFSQPGRDVVIERTMKMNETASSNSLWSNGFKSGSGENEMVNVSNVGTEREHTAQEKSKGTRNSVIPSQKPTDSEGEYMNTVDLDVAPENSLNNTNNYATLTDIEESIPETIYDDGVTSIYSQSKTTNNISSTLMATPKTMKESSNDCTDLDEITFLISQASPSRRVVIRKRAPDVTKVKGYSKNCDEKLIFSGDKVTHVKTDRKVICRTYDPK